jgi:hypothetical protein
MGACGPTRRGSSGGSSLRNGRPRGLIATRGAEPASFRLYELFRPDVPRGAEGWVRIRSSGTFRAQRSVIRTALSFDSYCRSLIVMARLVRATWISTVPRQMARTTSRAMIWLHVHGSALSAAGIREPPLGSVDFTLPRTNLFPKLSIIAPGNQMHIRAIEHARTVRNQQGVTQVGPAKQGDHQ